MDTQAILIICPHVSMKLKLQKNLNEKSISLLIISEIHSMIRSWYVSDQVICVCEMFIRGAPPPAIYLRCNQS